MQNFNAPAFGLGALAAAQLALGAPGERSLIEYVACVSTRCSLQALLQCYDMHQDALWSLCMCSLRGHFI